MPVSPLRDRDCSLGDRMLAASMAIGHLLATTEREPPRPPHRHQARPALGTSGLALSRHERAHLKAVEAIPHPPPRRPYLSHQQSHQPRESGHLRSTEKSVGEVSRRLSATYHLVWGYVVPIGFASAVDLCPKPRSTVCAVELLPLSLRRKISRLPAPRSRVLRR
jgi:hypothetical protein